MSTVTFDRNGNLISLSATTKNHKQLAADIKADFTTFKDLDKARRKLVKTMSAQLRAIDRDLVKTGMKIANQIEALEKSGGKDPLTEDQNNLLRQHLTDQG